MNRQVTSYRADPKDTAALQDILTQARSNREKEVHPAMFKLRVKNPKQPSIKTQLAEGKKQLTASRANAPQKTTVKNKNIGLGD